MPRTLSVVDDGADAVLTALRAALDGGAAAMPLAAGSPRAGLPRSVPDEVALVVQSSGSTGTPKRVALSAPALLASAAGSAAALGGQGQWLLALPTHYIAGINVLVRSIRAGTTPVVVPGAHFDPLAFVEAANLLDHPLRFTSLVPAQLSALLATSEALGALRSFHRILVGGQSIPERVLTHALELGLNLTRSYGSSETSGGCVYDGVPFGEVTARIVEGEIELGGPTLAEGYLGDEERTARQFHTDAEGRWYRTSDAGTITPAAHTTGPASTSSGPAARGPAAHGRAAVGVLHVTGRLDDVIISGGVKVSLSAIERIVTSLDSLDGAVVVGRADERWGEVPVVVSTVPASLEQIRDAVGPVLGAEARPAAVILVDSIPLLPSGKPNREALKNLYSPRSQ